MRELRLLVAGLLGATLISGCSALSQDDQEPNRERARNEPVGMDDRPTPATRAVQEEPTCRSAGAYEPAGDEPQRAIKRVAGRTAQAATTYRSGASLERLVATLKLPTAVQPELRTLLRGVVEPRTASCSRVIYPQLSGLTSTTAGVMVAVEQVLESRRGSVKRSRVLDVRLRKDATGWTVERIASIGGNPVARPDRLPPSAKRVLDHRGITLTDTARWDIHRGMIDVALLDALANAADKQPLSVLVLRTGHPPNVWATNRVSAHTAGRAADIWAVRGVTVAKQRRADPPRRLGAQLLAAGAAQVGSPQALGPRSFTDPVHQDHVHMQQR